MNRRHWLLSSAICLAVLVAGSFVTGASGGDADVLPSVHKIHAEAEVDCETCHENASSSTSGTDDLLPTMETCADCHEVDDESECSMCHSNVEAAGAVPRIVDRVGKFPHATHLEQGMACADCHGDGAKSEVAVPDMALCRDCHATAPAFTGCNDCHDAGQSLMPATHMGDWIHGHGAEARFDEQSCETCHTQASCQDCHAGDNVRPRSHGLNFAYDHALQARGNEFECASCHAEPSFCQACHVENHILPSNHSRGDWLIEGSGGRHAEEGRFDLESCIACHDMNVNTPLCAECHGE